VVIVNGRVFKTGITKLEENKMVKLAIVLSCCMMALGFGLEIGETVRKNSGLDGYALSVQWVLIDPAVAKRVQPLNRLDNPWYWAMAIVVFAVMAATEGGEYQALRRNFRRWRKERPYHLCGGCLKYGVHTWRPKDHNSCRKCGLAHVGRVASDTAPLDLGKEKV
jgi:hypothetical protein